MIELAWASNKTVKVAMKLDAWELIWNAGPVVKFVMIVLAGFSVVSWAIIFTKHTQLSKVTAENASFLDLFWKASSLENINAEVGRFKMSPLANVFRAGYSELQRIAESRLGEKSSSGALSLSGIENVSRALRKASDSEVAKIEGRTGFLATVGSTSPFIGLFGTVWGIMNSFQNIGNTGAASLSVVAPGISEALIATAIGLAAAIPAVMAYNYFVGKFKKQDLEINNFTADFLNIVKRNFFKD